MTNKFYDKSKKDKLKGKSEKKHGKHGKHDKHSKHDKHMKYDSDATDSSESIFEHVNDMDKDKKDDKNCNDLLKKFGKIIEDIIDDSSDHKYQDVISSDTEDYSEMVLKHEKSRKRKKHVTKESEYIDTIKKDGHKDKSKKNEYYFIDGKKINDFFENSELNTSNKKKQKKNHTDMHKEQKTHNKHKKNSGSSVNTSRLLNKVKSARQRIIQDNKVLRKENESIIEKNGQLVKENSDAKNELKEVTKVCKKINDKNVEYDKLIKQMRDALKSMKVENTKLQNKLKAKTDITNDIMKKYDNLKRKIDNIL